MAQPLSDEEKKKQEKDKYVKLMSMEGVTFIVEKKAANVSQYIKQMMSSDGDFVEREKGVIHFKEISTPILEKVCQYFYFKLRYQNTPTKSIPEFEVPPEHALELLKASNYLDT